jgi:hypothetical protein
VEQGREQVRRGIVLLPIFMGHRLGDVQASFEIVGVGHRRVEKE